jgi:hypothetical protein
VKEIWILSFILNTNYYGLIHVSPNQSLSASPPTNITLMIEYDTEAQCKEAMQAVKKHINAKYPRCIKEQRMD